jgi:transposase
MGRIGQKISLNDSDKQELLVMSRSNKLEHRYVQRAKIILLSDESKSYLEIQQQLQISSIVVAKWRSRFLKNGIAGLRDKPRSGKPPRYTEYDKKRVIQLACSKPKEGYTKWTQRRIAAKYGMSQGKVQTILANEQLRPHKTHYWCGKSTDPEFETKMIDVVGLYLNPPDKAIVLSVDEKTQIQALDRTQPELPMRSGQDRRLTNTYKRHGTVSLLAALAVHKGEITAKTVEKNNNETFLIFLKYLYRKYPRKQLHIIVDNLSVHKHQNVKNWLESKKRITMHYTPTYSSWLNQIEIWFGIMTRDVLKDGVWHSKKQLVNQILEYIETYNKFRAKPFNWTYAG